VRLREYKENELLFLRYLGMPLKLKQKLFVELKELVFLCILEKRNLAKKSGAK